MGVPLNQAHAGPWAPGAPGGRPAHADHRRIRRMPPPPYTHHSPRPPSSSTRAGRSATTTASSPLAGTERTRPHLRAPEAEPLAVSQSAAPRGTRPGLGALSAAAPGAQRRGGRPVVGSGPGISSPPWAGWAGEIPALCPQLPPHPQRASGISGQLRPLPASRSLGHLQIGFKCYHT